jgi:hypothetical protein
MQVTWGLVGLGAAALAFALLLGGREERIFSAARAAAAVTAVLLGPRSPTQTVVRDVAVALILFVVVLPFALKSTKAWPLAAASLCLATLMTGAAQALVHASLAAYGIVQGGWDLLADLVVVVGAWNAWRARQAGGRPLADPTDPA